MNFCNGDLIILLFTLHLLRFAFVGCLLPIEFDKLYEKYLPLPQSVCEWKRSLSRRLFKKHSKFVLECSRMF